MHEIDEDQPDAIALADLGIHGSRSTVGTITIELKDVYAVTGPLGLLGFGFTTIMLSFHNIAVIELSSIILGMGRFYGGLAQFVAGIFELRKGHTFSGVAFVSYACFWWTLCTIWTTHDEKLAPEGTAMGIFLIVWCVFTTVMFIGTFKSTWSLKAIFGTLAVTFLFLAIGDFTEMKDITKVGGAFGLLCGALAMYTGIAEILDHSVGYLHGCY
jgi:succinate-acetate transporter protein